MKSRLSSLEEKHDRFKHNTGEDFLEINKTFSDIKEVLSKKPNEEDLTLITANMDLLFNMIDKEMERKYAGKTFFSSMDISVYVEFFGDPIFSFYI